MASEGEAVIESNKREPPATLDMLSVIPGTRIDSGRHGELGEMTGECFIMTLQVICWFISLLFYIMSFIFFSHSAQVFLFTIQSFSTKQNTYLAPLSD